MEGSSDSHKDDNGGDDRPAYCSICGVELSNPSFGLNYPNFVCEECESQAVDEDGEEPWHGWPPGQEPEHEEGVIKIPPDQGENPVYIDGIKCWRRYNFGGYITFRDSFDCDSVIEFYDRHERGDNEFIQVYNSPDPPGKCLNTDRLLVQKPDLEGGTVRVWGTLSVDTGTILSRNVISEQKFGSFEDFLESVENHTGGRDHEEFIKDPTWMISVFRSFGSQAQKPKVLYLVPELDQPLSGLDAIVKTGALRGLREHEVADSIFELALRPVDRCESLYTGEKDETVGSMTLEEFGKETDPDIDGLTLTVRYELPYRDNPDKTPKKSVEIARTIFNKIIEATEGTDYTYLSSLPSVDIHAYRGQQEVVTIAVDSETLEASDWRDLSHPGELKDLARTFSERLS